MQRCRFHMWNCSYAVIKAGLRVLTAGQICATWLGPSHQRSMRARCCEPHGRRLRCSHCNTNPDASRCCGVCPLWGS